MPFDRVLTGARLACMTTGAAPYGQVDDAVLAIEAGRIAWIGPADALPSPALQTDHLDGRWITPALIDCHTHLVFGGNRSDEFERRLKGETYTQIAQSGGGINRTVKETRRLPALHLAADTLRRLETYTAEGVGTVEIKTGYGLDRDSELNMLKAIRAVTHSADVRICATLLAAHAIPVEYEGRSADYIDEVCIPLARQAAQEGLADAVDAYCERIAFSPEETRRLFIAAKAAGLPVKLHADQFSDLGGARLVAEFGGLSADHIEYASRESIEAMAASGTVGVILPGAFYATRETQAPPIEWMRELGVDMAVATDANPGSSPMLSLLTAANMACVLFGLTVEEALAGITRNAARALGRHDEIGTLEVGKQADLAVWDIEGPADLVQWIGHRPLHGRLMAGEWV
ncbi:imidazolonepropionase [Maricaulis sp. D1M11]|uniref:imidazolonepropionase n=1 Tax=Maricaulis sp. D1M11 TaxID=3076117 RepID=UPI0039B484E3